MFRFTIRDVLWLTALVAVALAVFFATSNRQTRWEYRIESGGNADFLSNVGAEGWELVAIERQENATFCYFKRQVTNSRSQKSD